MKEGFYWIRFYGTVQVARYSEYAQHSKTDGRIKGGRQLVGRQRQLMNTNEVEVISDLLLPPGKNDSLI